MTWAYSITPGPVMYEMSWGRAEMPLKVSSCLKICSVFKTLLHVTFCWQMDQSQRIGSVQLGGGGGGDGVAVVR